MICHADHQKGYGGKEVATTIRTDVENKTNSLTRTDATQKERDRQPRSLQPGVTRPNNIYR